MSARHSPARSIAAHAILILYTLIALFPVFVIVINSFKSRRAIFAQPLSLPTSETFDLIGYRTVLKQGNEISLTRTEYELLRFLTINAGKVLTHRELLREVLGPEYGEETECLRTFIKQLRRKLEADPSRPQLILTQPGMGYRLSV